MNYRGLINWLLSGVAVGGAVFMSLAFQEGIPTEARLTAAATAAGTAMWNHLRVNPMKNPNA